jgi:glycosyltransferase involved in cell wall biosynthesis
MGSRDERVTATRIFFFSQAPGVGGGERAVLPLLTRIDGIEVVVAAPEPVAAYARTLGLAAEVLDLSRAHRLLHAGRIAAGARRVQKFARSVQSHVLYANGTRAIPYALGAALLGARPLLFHHHGVLARGPVRALAAATRRWADAIVVPSRTAAAPFVFARDKIHVVPNGVDLAEFRPCEASDASKTALGIAPEATVVGTLTRADPSKGMVPFLDLAASVAGSLPHVRFVVAGGAAFPHEEAPYRRIVERAEVLGSRVIVTGRVENAAALYRALDVFVHLGDPEGFGLTVLEALASGVPVVAYDWGAIPEVFGDLITVVPPRDVDAAAAAVARLTTDSALRTELAARGRRAVEQRFGVDQTAAELGRVIAALRE